MKRFILTTIAAGLIAVGANANQCQSATECTINGSSIEQLNAGLSQTGVTLTNVEGKLVAFISDNITEFNLVKDLPVDSVIFEREYTVGKRATIALPFTTNVKNIKGARLAQLNKVTKEGSLFTGVEGTFLADNESNYSYNPYLLEATGTKITTGPVTLLVTHPENVVDYGTIRGFDEGWFFVSTTAKKEWVQGGANSCELGQIYGFTSKVTTSVSGKELDVGDFVKAKNNVSIRPLRAFLSYGTQCSPQGKPAASGASYAPEVAEEISVDDLPDRLTVTIWEPTVVAKIEDPVEGSEGGTTAMQKTSKIPSNVIKSNRWYDVTGRGLNNKPQSYGYFLHDRMPVIVK